MIGHQMNQITSTIKKVVLRNLAKMPSKLISSALIQFNRLQGRGWVPALSKEVETLRKLVGNLGLTKFVLLDIGANKGDYSKELRTYFPKTQIYAFEPSLFTFHQLKVNLPNDSNISFENLALGKVSQKSTLFYDQKGSGLASLSNRSLAHLGINFTLSEEVTVTTLREWVNEKNLLETLVMKLDVEGLEMDVLDGCSEILEKQVAIIQFEFGGANLDSRTYFKDFWKKFTNAKFAIYRLTPNGTQPIHAYNEIDEYPFNTTYYAVNINLSNYLAALSV
jgi:FkbM family methyltransferase